MPFDIWLASSGIMQTGINYRMVKLKRIATRSKCLVIFAFYIDKRDGFSILSYRCWFYQFWIINFSFAVVMLNLFSLFSPFHHNSISVYNFHVLFHLFIPPTHSACGTIRSLLDNIRRTSRSRARVPQYELLFFFYWFALVLTPAPLRHFSHFSYF